jgi:dihydrofolate reductase
MSIVTAGIAISVDGFAAGENQTLEQPLGDITQHTLHGWMFEQPDEHAEHMAALTAAKAFVMGRNMFGPSRGEWDLEWRGWWGEDPPYHAPVFVLTHHPRESIEMQGGTTFHFVTDGIEAALGRAREAAGDGEVAVAGGASTLNQYLAAGLIDELRLHIAPIVLGRGERLFEGVGEIKLETLAVSGNELVTHHTYRVVR